MAGHDKGKGRERKGRVKKDARRATRFSERLRVRCASAACRCHASCSCVYVSCGIERAAEEERRRQRRRAAFSMPNDRWLLPPVSLSFSHHLILSLSHCRPRSPSPPLSSPYTRCRSLQRERRRMPRDTAQVRHGSSSEPLVPLFRSLLVSRIISLTGAHTHTHRLPHILSLSSHRLPAACLFSLSPCARSLWLYPSRLSMFDTPFPLSRHPAASSRF